MMAAMRGHPARLAVAISAALCVAYLIWQPRPLDLSTQVFRADLWAAHGWVLWNDSWYSGQTVPGYSLLYPPLGALLGPQLLGVICAIGAAALFAAIASRAYGPRALLGIVLFGAGSTIALYGGRITFGLGLVLGLAAMLALQRERRWLSPIAAALAGLASPVAGVFTALAAAAVFAAARFPRDERTCRRGRVAFATALAATVSTLALVIAFPTPGFEPFTESNWIWIAALCLTGIVLLPRGEPTLRWAMALYLLVALVAFMVRTPLGANAIRLGATFAGPVAALALLGRRRPIVLAVVLVPLLYWQWVATVRDVAASDDAPSTRQAFYQPLLQELNRLEGPTPVRVEVPATRSRWESVYVAEHVPIARGWLRQLESPDFTRFTADRLTPASYERWLRVHGVSYVALANDTPDWLSADEVALLQSGGLARLHQVWSNADWRLWRVGQPGDAAARMASGGARVSALAPDQFRVRVPGDGEYRLRLRYSPYFEIDSGSGCLSNAGRASTKLDVTGPDRPQTIAVSTEFDLSGLLRRGSICSS